MAIRHLALLGFKDIFCSFGAVGIGKSVNSLPILCIIVVAVIIAVIFIIIVVVVVIVVAAAAVAVVVGVVS